MLSNFTNCLENAQCKYVYTILTFNLYYEFCKIKRIEPNITAQFHFIC